MTFASLYAGAGGMDLGFAMAGFKPVWASELDTDAAKTNKLILKDYTDISYEMCIGDIFLLKDEDLPYGVDLVIGGPPCQGFSVAGKMDPLDPRSKHVLNFIDIVGRLNPKVFVMENVKSFGTSNKWSYFRDYIVNKSNSFGYTVTSFILNAADYNVPQNRERFFIVGTRQGEFIPPEPSDQRFRVRDFLRDLPRYGDIGNNSFTDAKIVPAKSPILRKSPYSGMLFNGSGRPINLNSVAPTLPATMGGNRTPIIDQNELEYNTFIPWVVDYHKSLIAGHSPVDKVPSCLRRITVEEAAAIQSFPIGIDWQGSVTSRYKQIGNAVPPNLAYALGVAVKSCL